MHFQVVAALLAAGAAIDLPDGRGGTPLWIAAHMFQTELAKETAGDVAEAAELRPEGGQEDGKDTPAEEKKGQKRVLKKPVEYRSAMRMLLSAGADLGRLAPTLVEIVHTLQLANEDLAAALKQHSKTLKQLRKKHYPKTKPRSMRSTAHPLVAAALSNVGVIQYALGDLSGAGASLAEASDMKHTLFMEAVAPSPAHASAMVSNTVR